MLGDDSVQSRMPRTRSSDEHPATTEDRDDLNASGPRPTNNVVEKTTTHPSASSTGEGRPGMVSLPSHTNERYPSDANATPHVSDAQQRGIDAAAASHHEPKDASAGGIMGALSALHQKLEDGAEVVKESVDGWAERNVRTPLKEGEHMSEAHPADIPTLIDQNNEKNTQFIRAKMHSSNERAGTAALNSPGERSL